MDLELAGKAAIVTGGSKGIGFETALCLMKEGADVSICARSKEGLELAALADVSVPEDCRKIVDDAASYVTGTSINIDGGRGAVL